MKRILIFLCMICALGFCGCGKATETDKPSDSMFVIVEGGGLNSYIIAYHKETKVMYAVSNGVNNSGTFMVLVNPDGTPMIYEE